MFILIKLLWTLSDTLYSRYWACLLFRYKTSSNITGKQGAIKVYYFCFTAQNWNTLEAQHSAQRFAALDQVSRRILKNPGSFIMLLTGAHRQQEKSQPEGFSVQSESASKQTNMLPPQNVEDKAALSYHWCFFVVVMNQFLTCISLFRIKIHQSSIL